MKDPSFGMQAGDRCVVGNAYLCAHAFQVFQRSRLCRAGVGRGQHTQWFSVSNMLAQRLSHWGDATAANERHDQIDLVRGGDF